MARNPDADVPPRTRASPAELPPARPSPATPHASRPPPPPYEPPNQRNRSRQNEDSENENSLGLCPCQHDSRNILYNWPHDGSFLLAGQPRQTVDDHVRVRQIGIERVAREAGVSERDQPEWPSLAGLQCTLRHHGKRPGTLRLSLAVALRGAFFGNDITRIGAGEEDFRLDGFVARHRLNGSHRARPRVDRHRKALGD